MYKTASLGPDSGGGRRPGAPPDGAVELCGAFAFPRLGLHKVHPRHFTCDTAARPASRGPALVGASLLQRPFHDEVLMAIMAPEFLAVDPEAAELVE
ncbi:MAG: hypothetical protein ACM3XS_09145 [Bacteroidota bacterium]